MGIENYSKTPADNDQNPPFGWPEGMPPSGVNDSARQNMADTRTWYEDSQWVNLGYPVLFTTDNSFTFDNGIDYTATFHTGRRIKASGTSTGTIFGTIKTSTHSGSTTVTVEWDGSSILIDEALTIYIAALSKINDSLPYLNKTAKSAVASASTINLDQVRGDLVDVSGTTSITAITLTEGQERTVRFTGILTLTNGASLVLPSGANITTAAGDYAIFRGYASGVVRCVAYTRASGKAIIETAVPNATTSTKGISLLPFLPSISNNISDPNNDIDFTTSSYQFDDGSGQAFISAMTKRLDLIWAAGTNQGGLDSGVKANNTYYYIYQISDISDIENIVSDYLFSTSRTSPTLPSGYTKKQILPYCLRTDGSGNILAGTWCKDGTFIFSSALLIFDLSGAGNGTVSNMMPAVKCQGIVQMQLSLTQTGLSDLGVYGNLQTVQSDSSFISTISTNNNFNVTGTGVVYSDNGSISYKNFVTSGGVDDQNGRLISYKIL